jgi:hypothetical protein
MWSKQLTQHDLDHVQTALNCIYDHDLALECISDQSPDQLALLVAQTLMDSGLQAYLHVLAAHDWDFTAADLSW